MLRESVLYVLGCGAPLTCFASSTRFLDVRLIEDHAPKLHIHQTTEQCTKEVSRQLVDVRLCPSVAVSDVSGLCRT